eukprot:8719742-Ditylum_brightwellii.AAC.1
MVPAQCLQGKVEDKQTSRGNIYKKRNAYHREILTKLKEENTMRLYFQIIIGGLKKGRWGKYKYALKQLKDLEVDVLGFAETNLPWALQDRHVAQAKLKEEFNGKCKLIISAS